MFLMQQDDITISQARQVNFEEQNFTNDVHIPRANNPFKPLSLRAYLLFTVLSRKLKQTSGVMTISINELCEISGVCQRQNLNLMRELDDIFDFDYKNRHKYYRISYAENYLADTKESETKSSSGIFSAQKISTMEKNFHHGKKFPPLHPLSIYNINIEYRYTDIDTKKIVRYESNVKTSNRWGEHLKIVSQDVTSDFHHSKKSLSASKTLMHYYPLSQEDCEQLQKSSKREFDLRAMNEILLDVANRLTSHKFRDKEKFMKYMTKLLANELRQACLTNRETFRINNNIGAEEKDAIVKEKYLAEFEELTPHSITDEQRFQRSIAANLNRDTAYELLQAYRKSEIDEHGVCKLYLSKNVKLSPYDNEKLLNVSRATYESISFSTGVCVQILAIQIVTPSNNGISAVIKDDIITTKVNAKTMNTPHEFTLQDQRLLNLHKAIYQVFDSKEAYFLVHQTIYKASEGRLLIHFNQNVTLFEEDKTKLRQCIKAVYGDNIVITTKKQITETDAVYIDTGQDNDQMLKMSAWNALASAIKNRLSDGVFNAWFALPLTRSDIQIKEEDGVVKIYANSFWKSYVASNFKHHLLHAVLQAQIDLVVFSEDAVVPDFYEHSMVKKPVSFTDVLNPQFIDTECALSNNASLSGETIDDNKEGVDI